MFSPQEKQQVSNLVNNVLRPLNTVLTNELSVAVQQGQDPTLVKPVILNVKEAIREGGLTLTFLLGGNGSASFADPMPATRTIALNTAWFHLDRVKMFVDAAIKQLQPATGVNTVRAKTVWLSQILTGLTTVDRTLTYTDPSPNDHGTMVGPHGDWKRCSWEAWRAWWYLTDMFEYAMGLYGDLGVNWYAVVNKTPLLFGIFSHGMCRFTDIDTTTDEASLRATLTNVFGQQFFLLLGYGQIMTDFQVQGAPLYFHELQDAISSGAPALGPARVRISDSWRHFDKAIWHAMLEFPGCDLIKDPEGCAKKLPSQQPVQVIKEVLVEVAPRMFSTTVNGKQVTYVEMDPLLQGALMPAAVSE